MTIQKYDGGPNGQIARQAQTILYFRESYAFHLLVVSVLSTI